MHADDRARDAVLVTRWRAGDEAAFRALYDAWFDRVVDLVRRIVHDEGDAADVAHDVFVAAVRHRDDLRDPASFGGWLLRVARNRAIDHARRRRAVPVAEPDVTSTGAEDRARSCADPADVAADGEVAALVWQSVGALGDRDAEVIGLHVRQGLDPVDIAEVLGVTRTHAAQLLHRARERLGDAIRARVLWRGGRPACVALARQLAEAGAVRFDAATARLVGRHARSCEACEAQQRLRLAPVALFGAIPLASPAGLREQVWGRVSASMAAPGAPGAADAPGVPDGSGPGRPGRPGRSSTRGRWGLAGAAAGAVVAVAAVSIAVVGGGSGDTGATTGATTTAGAAATATAAPTPDATGPGVDTDPLVAAVTAGDVTRVRVLLDAGSDPSARDDHGSPVLFLAASYGFVEVVDVLLGAGAPVAATTASGATALHGAAEQGRAVVIPRLAAAGVALDGLDGSGRPAIVVAALAGSRPAVEALLAAGADPDRSGDGTTALHVAALFGLTAVAQALVDAGADRTARDASGHTPAEVAAGQGHDDLADLLDA